MTACTAGGGALPLAALLLAGAAHASERPPSEPAAEPTALTQATALHCRLDAVEPAGPPDVFTFDRLDRTGRGARLSRPAASPAAVWMLATATTLSFVETTAQGSVIVTTVFDAPAPDTPLLAVQSRHLTAMTGIPQIAQRTGECRPQSARPSTDAG